MITFKNVLCPIDLSEASNRALAYAVALARWYDAALDVIHVAPLLSEPALAVHDGVIGDPDWPASRDEILAGMQRVLEAAGAAAIEPHLITGAQRPADAIVARAAEGRADLLVMGTHGRSGFNRLLLGSVSEKVLRQAPCPVMTVPASAPAVSAGAVSFSRIVCAIDYSPSSLKALRYALELARQAAGRVTVLSALEYLDPEEPCEHVEFDIREQRRHFIEHARARLHTLLEPESRDWCEIDEVVAIGRAYKVILQHAADGGAQLIVMGAQGAGGLELMLYGSNTQHVLRAARCPVLTVHG